LGFLVFCHWRTSCPVASRFVFAFTGGRVPGEGLPGVDTSNVGHFPCSYGIEEYMPRRWVVKKKFEQCYASVLTLVLHC